MSDMILDAVFLQINRFIKWVEYRRERAKSIRDARWFKRYPPTMG